MAFVEPLPLVVWEVPWIAGGTSGIRHVRAPDPTSAAQDLKVHASEYGLPRQHVLGETVQAPDRDAS
jgi:hypothetical protein